MSVFDRAIIHSYKTWIASLFDIKYSLPNAGIFSSCYLLIIFIRLQVLCWLYSSRINSVCQVGKILRSHKLIVLHQARFLNRNYKKLHDIVNLVKNSGHSSKWKSFLATLVRFINKRSASWKNCARAQTDYSCFCIMLFRCRACIHYTFIIQKRISLAEKLKGKSWLRAREQVVASIASNTMRAYSNKKKPIA